MAEALTVAPITDTRFTNIATILPMAKRLYSAFNTNKVTVDEFNVLCFVNLTYSTYYLHIPVFIIPNTSLSISLATPGGNSYVVNITTNSNTVSFSPTLNGGLIAVLD